MDELSAAQRGKTVGKPRVVPRTKPRVVPRTKPRVVPRTKPRTKPRAKTPLSITPDIMLKLRVVLFIIGAIYLVVEIYYITAFINSYSLTSNDGILVKYKDTSKLISSLGIGFSVFVTLIYLLRSKRVISPPLIALVGAVLSSVMVYQLINPFIERQVDKAPEETILCAFLGRYAKENFLLNYSDAVPLWKSEKSFTSFEEMQVGLNLLPTALCTNPELLSNSFSSKATRRKFSNTIVNSITAAQKHKFKDIAIEAESKAAYLQSRITELYNGYNKVLATKNKRHYQIGISRLETALYKSHLHRTTIDKILKLNYQTRYNKAKRLTKNELYAVIARSEFEIAIGKDLTFPISLNRNIVNDLEVISNNETKKIISKAKNAWFKAETIEEIHVPDAMRDAVKLVVAPLVVMSLSGLSILLSAGGLISLLIPENKKEFKFFPGARLNVDKLSTTLRWLFSPIAIIVASVIFIPVTPTQSFLMKEDANPIISSLLKVQFYLYPRAIAEFAKHDIRPTLNFSEEIMRDERAMISHFERNMKQASNRYWYTTPSLQSVVFSAIAISNYQPLTKIQKRYLAKAFDFYDKRCEKTTGNTGLQACEKKDYLQSLYFNE